MKIDKKALEYLSGVSFHNGLVFQISDYETPFFQKVESRISKITDYCKNKKVLHIGCTDHIELITDKMGSGTWLHDILSKESSKCIGIDIDKEAIKHANKYCHNIFYCDVTSNDIPKEVSEEYWDLVVLGEVIEHIGNPLLFLDAMKKNIKATKLLITAPNAFRWNNIKNIHKGVECINSDHRFWFTPYTLAKILADAGFNPIWFCFAESFYWSMKRCVMNPIHWLHIRRKPTYCDTILMVASFE